MPTFKFTLLFEGVNIDDFEVLDRLVEAAPRVQWGEIDGEVHADVYTDAPSMRAALEKSVAAVRAAVPAARPVRIAEDLAAIPDVAKRCNVSRETVRLWTKDASFPPPRGIVGNGIKVWDWTVVNSWLREEHAGAFGDPYRLLDALEIAQANAWLRQAEIQSDAVQAEFHARPSMSRTGWREVQPVWQGIAGLAQLETDPSGVLSASSRLLSRDVLVAR